jgi:hypothetical protein
VTGWWFSTGTPVSSTNKTDRHDITEILLKLALRTIKLTNQPIYVSICASYQVSLHLAEGVSEEKIKM